MSEFTRKYVSSASMTPLQHVVRAAERVTSLTSTNSSRQLLADTALTKAAQAGASAQQAMAHVTSQFSGGLSSEGSFFEKLTARGDLSTLSNMGKSLDVAMSQLPESVMSGNRDRLLGTADIMFPSDLNMPYKFKLDIMEYERPTPLRQATTPVIEKVYLPLPGNLSEEFGISTTDGSPGTLGLIANQLDALATGTEIDGTLGDIGRVMSQAAYNVGYDIARAMSPELSGLLGQATGLIPNPHTTIYFQGVQLRQFVFSWHLAPESEKDTQMLSRLIRTLKMRTLPQFGGDKQAVQGTQLLQYPHIFQPSFLGPDGQEASHLFKFKRCMCTHLGVNYAPRQIPAFFKDGAPVSVLISMRLTELEFFTAEDFGAAAGTKAQELTDFLGQRVRGAAATSNPVGAIAGAVLGAIPKE